MDNGYSIKYQTVDQVVDELTKIYNSLNSLNLSSFSSYGCFKLATNNGNNFQGIKESGNKYKSVFDSKDKYFRSADNKIQSALTEINSRKSSLTGISTETNQAEDESVDNSTAAAQKGNESSNLSKPTASSVLFDSDDYQISLLTGSTTSSAILSILDKKSGKTYTVGDGDVKKDDSDSNADSTKPSDESTTPTDTEKTSDDLAKEKIEEIHKEDSDWETTKSELDKKLSNNEITLDDYRKKESEHYTRHNALVDELPTDADASKVVTVNDKMTASEKLQAYDDQYNLKLSKYHKDLSKYNEEWTNATDQAGRDAAMAKINAASNQATKDAHTLETQQFKELPNLAAEYDSKIAAAKKAGNTSLVDQLKTAWEQKKYAIEYAYHTGTGDNTPSGATLKNAGIGAAAAIPLAGMSINSLYKKNKEKKEEAQSNNSVNTSHYDRFKPSDIESLYSATSSNKNDDYFKLQ